MQITKPDEAPVYDAGNLREGKDRESKVLFAGKEGDLGNYRWYYSGGGEGEWKAPRHKHNFEQFRFVLSGTFEYVTDKRMEAGWVGYFPESVHYGPQVRHGDLTMLTLQFGGASGGGFMSQRERRQAYDELLAKGAFEKGAYTWLDADGKRHRQDSFEAVWEHKMGRKLVYPTPRYTDLIIMNPEGSAWVADKTAPGVARKWLGAFTERQVRAGFVKLDAGAALDVGKLAGTELMFLTKGQVAHEGKSHDVNTAFKIERNDGPDSIIAKQDSELFVIQLPDFFS
ncbi:MAG TPA: hypothetical protein VGM83_20075 [Devosiaceae bacterium]|jgi:hypothetical protein